MLSGTGVAALPALRLLASTCTSVEEETETIHREQKVTGERSGREEESSRDKTCADQFTFHTCRLLAQPLGQELRRPRSTLWGRAGMHWGAVAGLHRSVVCFVTFPCSRVRMSPSCSLQLQYGHPAWKKFWMWPDSFVDQCHFFQWSYTRSKRNLRE